MLLLCININININIKLDIDIDLKNINTNTNINLNIHINININFNIILDAGDFPICPDEVYSNVSAGCANAKTHEEAFGQLSNLVPHDWIDFGDRVEYKGNAKART